MSDIGANMCVGIFGYSVKKKANQVIGISMRLRPNF